MGKTRRVRFVVEHSLPGSPALVAATLCDPAFHLALELPDLGRPDVVEGSATDGERVLRLRYEFVGHLDPIARRFLGDRTLAWLQELRVDTGTLEGTLAFAAEADPARLHGTARVHLAAEGNARTRRRIAGDLHVRVPVIGGTAERRIVPGLVRRLDVEADALARVLGDAGPRG
jgi:hypothetical protein